MHPETSAKLQRRLEFLAADPSNVSLLAECVDLALELGRPGEAQSLVERSLTLKPEDPYLKARLANARLAGGDVQGAIEILDAWTGPKNTYNPELDVEKLPRIFIE